VRYSLISDIPGRMRVKLGGSIPPGDLAPLHAALREQQSVERVHIYPRAGSVVLWYSVDEADSGEAGGNAARKRILALLDAIDAPCIESFRTSAKALELPQDGAPDFAVFWRIARYALKRWVLPLPPPLRAFWALGNFVPFARAAARSLRKARLDVSVLDAASISASFVQGDFTTAGQTMLLLGLGETLEEQTRRRSRSELIHTLLNLDPRVVRVEGDKEIEIDASEVAPGDLVVVRTGLPINVDGEVERGFAMVNQASLTGEPFGIERAAGDSVFAGTVVEEGELYLRVRVSDADTRIRAVTSLVQRSEALKAELQLRMERVADRVVPFNFLLAAATGWLTRDFTRASAALMVDYSCALKMGGSIAVLSAMRDAAKAGFTVKGARFFEAFASADTLIFDKTGTLTQAKPALRTIIPVAGSGRGEKYDEKEILRLAACLEEHFPHPLARAVVNAAIERGIDHREHHAAVEYIMAHGIVSTLDGKRVVIGSEHFVVHDENVAVAPALAASIASATEGLSPLYLAIDNRLVGVLGIDDPLKNNVRESVERLRAMGFLRIVMLTGDNRHAAARVAESAGIGEYYADLLPEDKHRIIEKLKEEGARVVMVGDGVNDSPALARADVGVALGQGTAIAREVADITCAGDDLEALIQLRALSCELKQRLERTSRNAIGFNSAIMAGGVLGLLQPNTSSLLHNSSTVALCLENASPYLGVLYPKGETGDRRQ
jgi:heavy metal translocating P-type ATPase